MSINMPSRPAPFAWGEADPMQQTAETLWPGEAPGWKTDETEELAERALVGPGHTRHRTIRGVSRPAMQAFLPPLERATGAAVAVFPGGAHEFLSMDLEGYDVARWLNGAGIAALVVKYRTGRQEQHEQAIAAGDLDAQRAVQLVRSRAAVWGLDPRRIGAMGFSAGGRLVVGLATAWDEGAPGAADPAARVSARPDFVAPVYAGMAGLDLVRVTAQTSPAFLVQACDDFLPVEGSVGLFRALRAAQVPAELHLYEKGGHGFGLGVKGGAVATWPSLFELWIKGLA